MGGIGMTAMGEVHALFALPMPDAQRPMGVLELYRRTAGGFAAAEYASAAASAVAVDRRLARIGGAGHPFR